MEHGETGPTGIAIGIHDSVPKICGADVELGNFIIGARSAGGSGYSSSRSLLREIQGVPQSPWSSGKYYGHGASIAVKDSGNDDCDVGEDRYDSLSQDYGRKFLASNGGCAYIDLNHLELNTPEVSSAYDHVAAWHAMLLIAREAMLRANRRLAPDRRIQVLVNNSDGVGNSYGSHFNYLISRRAWDNIFCRKLHYLAYLASYQATSIIFTGQGKVGAENGAPDVDYQLSQRADFFEIMVGRQTTFSRPLVNSRDEPLCGKAARGDSGRSSSSRLARLHCIFYDSNLCHVANLLKCGMMQIVLAMLEAGAVRGVLILDDPLAAVRRFSHDPSLTAHVRTASGKRLSAIQWQMCFLEDAQRFVDAGRCDGLVPRAREILALCADTLAKLHSGDWPALTGRLDWLLKRAIIQRAMSHRPHLRWSSPEIKHLDHLYSSLDLAEGLYWVYEHAGLVERVVSPAEIERLVHEPPQDTRAYGRAMLLRRVGQEHIDYVNWDSIELKVPNSGYWPARHVVEMPNPAGFNKADTEALWESGGTWDRVLQALSLPQGSRIEKEPVVSFKY